MSKVKNFLNNYENSGTKKNLKSAIKLFFQSIYEEATLENLDEFAEKYFSEKRQIEDEDKNKEEEKRRRRMKKIYTFSYSL